MPAWSKSSGTRVKLALAWLLSLWLALGGVAHGQARGGCGEAFSAHVLAALRAMPRGGGYAADRAAELRLAQRGIGEAAGRLRLSPSGASPTFCSAACYMALLHALCSWEKTQPRPVFSPAVWHNLRVEACHPDGFLSWGRVNANGPGFAKWVHDLGAGQNFSSPWAAQPGDFLKYFRSPAIGAKEKGHLVIFLGLVEQSGQTSLLYWSCNQSGGYGERMVPLKDVYHPIFTRITRPERIAAAPTLPEHDSWLADMLTHSFSYEEVRKRCRILSTPAP